MVNQPSLPGFESAPERSSKPPKPQKVVGSDNVFFAVLPPSGAADEIERCRENLRIRHQLTGTRVPKEKLHISLLGLFEGDGIPDGLFEFASRVARRISLPAFGVRLDSTLSFYGKTIRPHRAAFVLTDSNKQSGFVSLHHALADAFEQERGHATQRRSGFNPHVTLLYDYQNVKQEAVEPIEWMAQEFALIHSRPHTKSSYSIVNRWSLQQ